MGGIRRFDWPAFLRHSETAQTNRLKIKPIRQRSQHPFPKSPPLHSRYVRSDFRNGRSLPRHHGILYVQPNGVSGGFLKLESLDFWMTPSPNEIVWKKDGSKPSGKKRQKAAMNLSQYDAFCRWQFAASCRLLSLLNPFATLGFYANSPVWNHSACILIGCLKAGRPTPTENRSFLVMHHAA
jgi:hypothetical protein